MKKLTSLCLVCLLIIAGCTRKGSTVTPPVYPPSPILPKLNITTPDTGWYNSSVSISYSSTNADKVSIDGIVMPSTSGTYIVNNVTGPRVVNFIATNQNGSDTKSVTANVYSDRYTTLTSTGMWTMTYDRFYEAGVWSPWYPSSCFKITFFPNKKCVFHSSLCSPQPDSPPAPWTFNEDETKLTFGMQTFNIVLLNRNTMILSIVNSWNQIVEMKYEH